MELVVTAPCAAPAVGACAGQEPAGGPEWTRPRGRVVNVLLVTVLLWAAGCSRAFYRLRADREASQILQEVTAEKSWEVPPDFSIDPPPESRLYLGGDPDRPPLPPPYPQLYAYTLPVGSSSIPRPEQQPPGHKPDRQQPPEPAPRELLPPPAPESDTARPAVYLSFAAPAPRGVKPAVLQQPLPQGDPPQEPAQGGRPSAGPQRSPQVTQRQLQQERVRREITAQLFIAPLPSEAWHALPRSCLMRMLEFRTAREEYQRTFRSPPPAELRDPSPRLAFEQLFQLALLNSREYQAQKEQLYRAALAVSLARFDYDLKFTPTANGTTVDYLHFRSGGTTVNTLRLPTRLALQKLLWSGGDLLARLANDIVLTFNGPRGFESDVSSQLLLQLSQAVFQRDIVLEPLIQAERNLVYAARDYLRFRRRFFVQVATEYYELLRAYRQVEIDAQNYFSLVRAFEQALAEEQAGLQSRIQVEQIEQSMLQGRSSLIRTCNQLDNAIDAFKLTLGLPTEQPLNLDLEELRRLTEEDEIEVARERARRAARWLEQQLDQRLPDQAALVNASAMLAQRIRDWLQLRRQRGEPVELLERIEHHLVRLQVEQARFTALQLHANLHQLVATTEFVVPPELVVQRAIDYLEASLELGERQMRAAELAGLDPKQLKSLRGMVDRLAEELARLRGRFSEAIGQADLAAIEQLRDDAERIARSAEQLVARLDRAIGLDPAEEPQQRRQRIGQLVNDVHEAARRLLDEAGHGLVPVEITMDNAMLTALFNRLDLMNERGRVADARRDIKYAADDLRSVLNLQATQLIRTKADRPFGFTFDESSTQLRLILDLPLNRKQQRNQYREALIDYYAAVRRLMEREDSVKLSVRRQLRNLALARALYEISVASAALAAERVVNTRMQLALGLPGVAARDFLEAQDAYRRALSAVADNRIGYITDRMQFFLDLELIELDQRGMWPQFKEMNYQPTPVLDWPDDALPVYGTIPEFLWLSEELRATERAGYPPFRHADWHMLPEGDPTQSDAEPVGENDEPFR